MCQTHRHFREIPCRANPARPRFRLWALAVSGLLLTGVSVPLAIDRFGPSDLEQAEAELRKAHEVVAALADESLACEKAAEGHKLRAAECQKIADRNRDTSDTERFEFYRAKVLGHTQLGRAKSDRRDNLIHLNTINLRLLAEAECEILRAKDARDRGTPYEVAPRVRALLAPVFTGL